MFRAILIAAALLLVTANAARAEDFVETDGDQCVQMLPAHSERSVCTLTTSAVEASSVVNVSPCKRFTFLAWGSVTAMPQACDDAAGTSCSALAATALTGGGDPFAWGTSDAFQFVRVDVTASGGTVELVCGG